MKHKRMEGSLDHENTGNDFFFMRGLAEQRKAGKNKNKKITKQKPPRPAQ